MAVKEVGCEGAVEGFMCVGGEEESGDTASNALVFRMPVQNRVQSLTIKGGDVLYVTFVFQTSFHLKRDNACVHHLFEIISTAHIFQ